MKQIHQMLKNESRRYYPSCQIVIDRVPMAVYLRPIKQFPAIFVATLTDKKDPRLANPYRCRNTATPSPNGDSLWGQLSL